MRLPISSAHSIALTARQYLWRDRLTKLAVLGLVSLGLDAVVTTATGVLLAFTGVLIGTSTVVMTNPQRETEDTL